MNDSYQKQKPSLKENFVSKSVNYIEGNGSARLDSCAIEHNLETNQLFYLHKEVKKKEVI
jgi:hypothetical protein